MARGDSNSALFQNEDLSAGKHCDFVTADLVWFSVTTSFQKCLKPQWLQMPTLLIPDGMQESHCLPPLHCSLIPAGKSHMSHAGRTYPNPCQHWREVADGCATWNLMAIILEIAEPHSQEMICFSIPLTRHRRQPFQWLPRLKCTMRHPISRSLFS